MNRLRLDVSDVTGIFAIMPTPAHPNASDWRELDTVDLGEAARAARALVEGGVAAVMTTGTFGEAATLTWEEHQAFVATVVDAVGGRVPVLPGPTTLNTRDTITRGRAFQDLGATGFLLGRPMWCALEDRAIVQFYSDVAEALPDMAIVVYDNPASFKGKLSPEAYAALSTIPQVVAAKYTPLGDQFHADLAAVSRRMRLMPIDEDWYQAYAIDAVNASACWSAAASCGPGPLVALQQALRTGDSPTADTLTRAIVDACAPLFPNGDFATFAKYNIAIDKAWIDAAGFIKAGPPRPPYHVVPDEYVAAAQEAATRWRRLCRQYGDTSPTGSIVA